MRVGVVPIPKYLKKWDGPCDDGRVLNQTQYDKLRIFCEFPYAHPGSRRTIMAVADEMGEKQGNLAYYVNKYDWWARAQLYDEEVRTKVIASTQYSANIINDYINEITINGLKHYKENLEFGTTPKEYRTMIETFLKFSEFTSVSDEVEEDRFKLSQETINTIEKDNEILNLLFNGNANIESLEINNTIINNNCDNKIDVVNSKEYDNESTENNNVDINNFDDDSNYDYFDQFYDEDYT